MKKFLFFIPAILVMTAIFYFSSQSGPESTKLSDSVISAFTEKKDAPSMDMWQTLNVIIRKSAHFIEYMALGAALAFGFRFSYAGASKIKYIMLSTLVSAVYAVSDEIHQYFVPGRACMLTDVGIDTIGSLSGALLMILFIAIVMRIKEKKRSSKADSQG
ncbi:MAG: VanZ family protein [Huintestinicola sp.]